MIRTREQATAWARRMLCPGAAVLLDTETASLGGAVCEIAVQDTGGAVLLDTLINPGCPIDPAAQKVHGITDSAVAAAPAFAHILPTLLEVTADRWILAYNADYDAAVITAAAHAAGRSPGHLADPATWGCVMRARSAWLGHPDHFVPLSAAHRAAGDTSAALRMLREIAGVTAAARP